MSHAGTPHADAESDADSTGAAIVETDSDTSWEDAFRNLARIDGIVDRYYREIALSNGGGTNHETRHTVLRTLLSTCKTQPDSWRALSIVVQMRGVDLFTNEECGNKPTEILYEYVKARPMADIEREYRYMLEQYEAIDDLTTPGHLHFYYIYALARHHIEASQSNNHAQMAMLSEQLQSLDHQFIKDYFATARSRFAEHRHHLLQMLGDQAAGFIQSNIKLLASWLTRYPKKSPDINADAVKAIVQLLEQHLPAAVFTDQIKPLLHIHYPEIFPIPEAMLKDKFDVDLFAHVAGLPTIQTQTNRLTGREGAAAGAVDAKASDVFGDPCPAYDTDITEANITITWSERPNPAAPSHAIKFGNTTGIEGGSGGVDNSTTPVQATTQRLSSTAATFDIDRSHVSKDG